MEFIQEPKELGFTLEPPVVFYRILIPCAVLSLVDYTLSDDVTISQISYPFGYRVLTECDAQNVDILLDL